MYKLVGLITHPFPVMNGFSETFHVLCKARANGGAMRKKEIGNDDLAMQVIPTNGSPFLVGQRKIFYLVPNGIRDPFSFFSYSNNGVGEIMPGHINGVLCFFLEDKEKNKR